MYSIMTGEDICRSNLLGAVLQNTVVAGNTAGSASAGTGHLRSSITTGEDVCSSNLLGAVLQDTVVAGNTAGSASAGTGHLMSSIMTRTLLCRSDLRWCCLAGHNGGWKHSWVTRAIDV